MHTKHFFLLGAIALFVVPSISSAATFPKPSVDKSTITKHRATIQWEAQSNVDFYRIRLLDSTCTTLLRVKDIASTATEKRLKNLDTNTRYCVRMRAFYTDNTKSDLSDRKKFTTKHANRFGLNFIRFYNDDSAALEEGTTPSAVDSDFSALGIDTFRQITSADLLWELVEAREDTFDFANADGVLKTTTHKPIVDLFSYQLADSTTPWEMLQGDDTVEPTLTQEAEDYVVAVVERYKDDVKFWEIGNEMAHWELEQPGVFPVADQARWLKAVSDIIREHDDNAVILLPGLISITEDNVDDWLEEVVHTVGSDWFDVVNYHYYGRWQGFAVARDALQNLSEELDISDKLFWQTETGTSSDPTNTTRTNYPNSTDQQAADIFRRAMLAYDAGDEVIMWHTYIGNDDDGEAFRYFGVVNEDMSKQPAYYTVQLLTDEITKFTQITRDETASDQFVYDIERPNGSHAYVAWDAQTSTMTVPSDVSEMTSVVPNSNGTFTWTSVTPGETISLTDIPVLMK
ncbi:MAG: hypothetical protein KIH62_005150 [Candidatus Kerfeldbacteria bacterium]|nr:hypothetical protein [Candidatus Kerfeldbacteria bacterium]